MSPMHHSPMRFFADKVAARSPLTHVEQQVLANLPGHAAQIPANVDYVRLGERVEHACLVVRGIIGRCGRIRGGNRQIVAVHIKGDMADIHSVVAPDAGSALQALTATTILRVPHSALRDAVRLHPAIAEAFWRESAIDASVLATWIANIGARDGLSRTAHLLCELACRYEATGLAVGFQFTLPITQAQLADMLGLTTVHVNRMLTTLKQRDILRMTGRTVQVLDWAKLTTLGDFEPGYLQLPKAGVRRAGRGPGSAFGASSKDRLPRDPEGSQRRPHVA